MDIKLDEGFLFGLGAFETVAVYGGCPVFLEQHLERLARGLEFLGISRRVTEEEVYRFLRGQSLPSSGVLKIVVSEKNTLFLPRENPYKTEDYEKGFTVDFALSRQNETSRFVFHKTLNYGECIRERREAAARGLNEAVFLNSRGEICEGTASNIFFVRNGQIVTPDISSGLLPGVMRGYLLERYDIREERLHGAEISRFDECFLANSLMGVMPVLKFGGRLFETRETADRLGEDYQREYCLPGQA